MGQAVLIRIMVATVVGAGGAVLAGPISAAGGEIQQAQQTGAGAAESGGLFSGLTLPGETPGLDFGSGDDGVLDDLAPGNNGGVDSGTIIVPPVPGDLPSLPLPTEFPVMEPPASPPVEVPPVAPPAFPGLPIHNPDLPPIDGVPTDGGGLPGSGPEMSAVPLPLAAWGGLALLALLPARRAVASLRERGERDER